MLSQIQASAGRRMAVSGALMLFILGFVRLCFASGLPHLPAFTAGDRIMIFAPHPDDETLGTGGVIQAALAAGARVKVVCYTNGDHNEPAFIVYEKRLVLRTGGFLYMGKVRAKETRAAMASLGLTDQDIVFLGYPDFGTTVILTQYWQTDRPYRSLLTRISKVSYPEALSFNAPYVGESILRDITAVIRDFRPTRIFVSHPADSNVDHASLYVFVQVALLDLGDHLPAPQVLPYLVHVVGWPKPRGAHLELRLDPPAKLTDISLQEYDLTDAQEKTKQKLVSFYKSQIEYNPPYLYTFVRSNELFGDYRRLELFRHKYKITWQDVVVSPEESALTEDQRPAQNFSGLAFARKDQDLYIRLTLRHTMDKNFGILIYLLGYNPNVEFARMPKIRISMGLLGMRVMDKKKAINGDAVKISYEGTNIILRVPLSLLGDPACIFSKVRTHTRGFPLDASAWRILGLK